MNNLENALNDFYSCLNIPIQFINENFSPVYKVGFYKDIDLILENVNIYSNLKEKTVHSVKITYFNHIHFILLPIKTTQISGYFLAGPFKSKSIYTEFNIPFKPYSCIDHILSMLKNIINDNINNTTFSFYVRESINYIHKNYASTNIDNLCNHLNINKSYFCSLFKKETGYTFTNFLNKYRIEKSKKFLQNKNLSILDVALSVGYNSHNYYTSIFKKYNDISPIEYRHNIKYN